jgi:hypothetical protein
MPRWEKNFFRWRLRSIAKKLEILENLITFQVMRRTLGTNLQHHGTLKDAQGALRTRASKRRAMSKCKRSRQAPERDELPYHGDPRRLEASHPGWEKRQRSTGRLRRGEPSRSELNWPKLDQALKEG